MNRTPAQLLGTVQQFKQDEHGALFLFIAVIITNQNGCPISVEAGSYRHGLEVIQPLSCQPIVYVIEIENKLLGQHLVAIIARQNVDLRNVKRRGNTYGIDPNLIAWLRNSTPAAVFPWLYEAPLHGEQSVSV